MVGCSTCDQNIAIILNARHHNHILSDTSSQSLRLSPLPVQREMSHEAIFDFILNHKRDMRIVCKNLKGGEAKHESTNHDSDSIG
jgi:hypothetical protein